MTEANDITRREAIARTALLLGGTFAAAHLAGARAPPGRLRPARTGARRRSRRRRASWSPPIAEHIIPATDTPGARAAGVDRFVDVILTNYYKAPERERFLAGLADLDTRSQKENGKAFLQSTPAQQVALLRAMDGESYPPERVLAKAEPLNTERAKMRDSLVRPEQHLDDDQRSDARLRRRGASETRGASSRGVVLPSHEGAHPARLLHVERRRDDGAQGQPDGRLSRRHPLPERRPLVGLTHSHSTET
jgi:hypothetical protein